MKKLLLFSILCFSISANAGPFDPLVEVFQKVKELQREFNFQSGLTSFGVQYSGATSVSQ